MRERTGTAQAIRVSTVSIVINLLLSAFKFAAGLFGNSSAMLSDAVHSASDVFSTLIVIIGVNIAGKKSDSSHQYGHERMESMASVLLAGVLFATGVGIGMDGIRKIVSGTAGDLPVPDLLPLIAAVVSIAVKEWMYWYTRATAKRIHSPSLMADAWHHRSDALSSVGSLVGIAGARLGLPILDPIASVVICLLIIKAAYDICRSAIGQMVDRSIDGKTTEKIRELVLSVEGVLGVDLLMTRLFGSKFYVDIEIAVDGSQTLYSAHAIAERVHDAVEAEFPNAKHCMVHMNPYEMTSENGVEAVEVEEISSGGDSE